MSEPIDRDGALASSAVRANYVAQREAMLAADPAALDVLLAEGFTLTHMTGYVQPKSEWLADLASGAMRYHAMDEAEVIVGVEDAAAVLTVRTRTEATVWGSRGIWPLQLRIRFTREGGLWLAADTVASAWR